MKCVIIAGAPHPDLDFIRQTAQTADCVICADRGYAYARQAGIEPQVIIGDFDSFSELLPQNKEIITLQREKMFSDTVHCIDKAVEMGYNNLVILAATGGRLDHTLCNCYALEYAADHGAHAILLSERERVELLMSESRTYEKVNGRTFSLFPFGTESAEISIEGAHYPLDRYTMTSGMPIGLSNVFEGGKSRITVHSGKAILIINQQDQYL